MTKMYLSSFVTFTRNKIRGTHFSFFKRDFISEILSGRSYERKVHFLQLAQDSQNFQGLRFSVYINVVLLINFPEQFELCFYFKYSRSYKVL